MFLSNVKIGVNSIFLRKFVTLMSDRPKILHLNTVADSRNGVGQIMNAIHRQADRFGFESAMFVGYGTRGKADYTVESQWRYRINALKSRLWAEDAFLPSRNMRRLCREIERFNPEIVHIHNLHGYYSDLRMLARCIERIGAETVVTMHDLWFTTGRCAYPPDDGCTEFCDNCPFPQRYPSKWIKGRSMKEVKTDFLRKAKVVVPSLWMAARTSEYIPAVIPNGIDRNVFCPQETDKQPFGNLLAVAARWTDTKGIGDLLKLADRLPQGMTLSLIGKKVPRHERITDLGYLVNPTEIARVMNNSDILLSAATQEAFGLTVAEAIGCGVPVIVRENTAPADSVINKDFVVDFSDIDAVLDAITKIKSRSENDKADKTNSFAVDFIQPLSIEEMTVRYYSVYKDLLSNRNFLNFAQS